MAKVPGYELEGLAEIGRYLDVSRPTVHRLIMRKKRPPPVVKYLSFLLAKKSDLDAWRAGEIACPAYAGGKNAVHRAEERERVSGEAA